MGKVVIIVAGLVTTIIAMVGAGNAVYTTAKKEIHLKENPKPVFVDFPDLLVPLNSQKRKTVFMKLKYTFEVDNKTSASNLTDDIPYIVDSVTIMARDLNPEMLNGSSGIFLLKEKLLRIVTMSRPYAIKDILIKELLIQ